MSEETAGGNRNQRVDSVVKGDSNEGCQKDTGGDGGDQEPTVIMSLSSGLTFPSLLAVLCSVFCLQ